MIKREKNVARSKSHCGRLIGFALIGGAMFSMLLMGSPQPAQYGQGGIPPASQQPDLNQFPGSIRTSPRHNRGLPAPGSQEGVPDLHSDTTVTRPLGTAAQKEALLQSNMKQMKKHAGQLAQLAQSLQKKINQTNVDVLSVDIIKKAEAIEKLAKKIKDEAKGP